MNNKYIWNENDIKFVDKDQQKQDVEYSSATSFGCPFAECSCNTSCNGKCLPSQEEKAYDLACEIYDEIIASTNSQCPKELLVSAKNIINKSKQFETATVSFITCLKIQLIHEIQTQLNCIFSKEDKDNFLNG